VGLMPYDTLCLVIHSNQRSDNCCQKLICSDCRSENAAYIDKLGSSVVMVSCWSRSVGFGSVLGKKLWCQFCTVRFSD